jgi:hypothetical protein
MTSLPILQQDKSTQLTTNPFIANEQKERELQLIESEANNIIATTAKNNTIKEMSLKDINTKISTSFIGFLDDLFIKPNDTPWIQYISEILQKDERYTYIGILLILIGFYFLLARSN